VVDDLKARFFRNAAVGLLVWATLKFDFLMASDANQDVVVALRYERKNVVFAFAYLFFCEAGLAKRINGPIDSRKIYSEFADFPVYFLGSQGIVAAFKNGKNPFPALRLPQTALVPVHDFHCRHVFIAIQFGDDYILYANDLHLQIMEALFMTKKLLIALLPVLLLASCGGTGGGDSSDKLTIYTSFYPIYYMAQRIAKEKANVINMTPAGSEPHDYSPTTKDIVGMADADVLFVNGLGLENWTGSLTAALLSKTITVTHGIEAEEISGTTDPHVWLNPMLAIKEMGNIADALIKIDAANADYYKKNLEDATYLLASLDSSFLMTAAAFANKYIVVSHAAFGYFCNRYGLNQIYVDGISPDDEPTAKALEEVIADVKKYGINTIFSEELVSADIAESIAEKTHCDVEVLNPLEGLTNAELQHEDYVSVMVSNMRKLKAACGDRG